MAVVTPLAAELRARHTPPFLHRWVGNAPLQDALRVYQDENALRSLPAPNQRVIRRMIFQNFVTPLREWDVWLASFEVKECHLLEAIKSELEAGRVLTVLILFRSLVEHAALFEEIRRRAAAIPEGVPSVPTSAVEHLTTLSGILAKGYLGTRMAWGSQVFDGAKFRELEKKGLEYQAGADTDDMKAVHIETAIDNLGKRLSGARPVYNFLCEFAHPNLGTTLAVSGGYQATVDASGVPWGQRSVGFSTGTPVLDDEGPGSPLSQCFEFAAELVLRSSQTVRDCQALRPTIQARVQTALRAMPMLTVTFDRNEACPCLSGERLRQCCGR